MIDLFLKGGAIMWPLLALSLVATAIVIERMIFILRESIARNRKAAAAIFECVEKGEFDSAVKLGSKSKDPVSRVLVYAMRNRACSLSSALMRAANIELKRYNRGITILDTIVTLAPLLGLLGTVTGMIAAFGILGGSELDAPTAITGGIAEALIATAFGLVIAIVSLLPFNYLNSRLDEIRHEIEDCGTQLELLLMRQSLPENMRSRAREAA